MPVKPNGTVLPSHTHLRLFRQTCHFFDEGRDTIRQPGLHRQPHGNCTILLQMKQILYRMSSHHNHPQAGQSSHQDIGRVEVLVHRGPRGNKRNLKIEGRVRYEIYLQAVFPYWKNRIYGDGRILTE